MQRNTTPDEGALTPQQETALAALLAGETVTRAAATARVDRGTLHRWLRADHVFRAALNAALAEVREATRTRLLRLGERAVEALDRSLASDQAGKLALELLRGLGMLPGEAWVGGSGDPAALRAEAEAARAQETRREAMLRLADELEADLEPDELEGG